MYIQSMKFEEPGSEWEAEERLAHLNLEIRDISVQLDEDAKTKGMESGEYAKWRRDIIRSQNQKMFERELLQAWLIIHKKESKTQVREIRTESLKYDYPKTEFEARERLADIELQISDIELQLKAPKDSVGMTHQKYKEWRKNAEVSLLYKIRERKLVKAWFIEHTNMFQAQKRAGIMDANDAISLLAHTFRLLKRIVTGEHIDKDEINGLMDGIEYYFRINGIY